MSIPPDRLTIGRALLAGGPVTQETLRRELERSDKLGSVLGKALLQSGFPSDAELIAPLLARLRIPKINARNTKIPLETVRVVPPETAKRCRVLAIDQIGQILVVVTPDLANEAALAEVRQVTGLLVTPIQCAPEGFDQIVADYYQRLAESGLGAAAPVAGPAATVGSTSAAPAGAPAAAPASNGALRAIPAGSEDEDAWWKRYMTAGPVPVEEVLM